MMFRAKFPGLLAMALLGGFLLAIGPAFASMERALAAQGRGDLRAAQIELRNAVRGAPGDAGLRMALAQASLDIGDADTAEKEARAALERRFDAAEATALIIRAQIGLNRAREVLREFAEPAADAPPALAGQILAGRALAHLMLNQAAEARAAAEAAVRAAPGLVDVQLAMGTVLGQAGDRAGAEAAVDAALRAEPGSARALLRKSAFLFERGELRPAEAMVGRVIAAAPGNVTARIQRAEARMRLGEEAGAREDVDAALRTIPGSVPAIYLRAALLARAQDWRGADESLSQLGAALPNIPDALLLLATVKRQINQRALALDAAQRHLARRPEDPRGAKLVAGLEMEAGRNAAAAGVLNTMVSRGVVDAELLDMLGRAQIAAGRPREAAEAFRRANEILPGNAALLSRLAAARLNIGDVQGMAEAAQAALQAEPNGPGARLMLALGGLARGDLVAAEAELGRLDPAARASEPAQVLEGTIRLIRFDAPGARGIFQNLLRQQPESVPSRMGLARVASVEGNAEEAERLLGEVLRRDPANQEAISRLVATVMARGPRAASVLATLEAVQAENPREANLAFAFATLLAATGQQDRAVALLQSDTLRSAPGAAAAVAMRVSEIRAAQERWPEAEAAARAALADSPNLGAARRQLALLLARRGDTRNAETLIDQGLRNSPADPVLQAAAIGLAQREGGLEAALAAADQLTRRPGSMPTAASLRGDLLMGARRAPEAAEAYAAAAASAPSSMLALRLANAQVTAGRPAEAAAALQAWLAREPNDAAALAMLGQLELQQGRTAEAERRFRAAVERAPQDAVTMNNLAWLLQERGTPAAGAEARLLAERAFFLSPTAEIADTLGWVLARNGEPGRAVPLLRLAAAGAAAARAPASPGIAYRLAVSLNASGQREEAVRVLEPVLAENSVFPERVEAERFLASLRGPR